MNKKINELNKNLNDKNADILDIESQLQIEWNNVFKDLSVILVGVTKVESSTEYLWDKYGEIVSWARFSDLSDFQDCKQYFTEYMREYHCVDIDWENECLTYSVGPSIVINDNGDVYDQDGNKFFISKSDYSDEHGYLDESKRNELIEAYMLKTDCYPGVFKSDRHGNVTLIDTKAVV